MTRFAFTQYDAFSDRAFGGSQAAVVSNADDFTAELREKIARELGLPATAFVSAVSGNTVRARFLSTVMELPMCGHGTICLMTRLVETGELVLDSGCNSIELVLPSGTATVEVTLREDGRPEVMLDVATSRFRQDQIDDARLANLLGIDRSAYADDLPIETACADFVHLVVPIATLRGMQAIQPDFPGIIDLCRETGIETVVAFSMETVSPDGTLHVRDFCPAVGVWESSSAGTTNGALACYLVRHGLVEADRDGRMTVLAEQGIEIGRASRIKSMLTIVEGQIDRLQVGGVATKLIEGELLVDQFS